MALAKGGSEKAKLRLGRVLELKDSTLIPKLVESWRLSKPETKRMCRFVTKRIRQVRKTYKNPIVILIGGNYGVGKTTFSFELSKILDIPPRSSLGTVVKTVKYLGVNHPAVALIDDDQDIIGFKNKFDLQSKFLCEIVNYIALKAQESGSDYIIDGVQINPGYINRENVLLTLILAIPNGKDHLLRLTKPITHFRRTPKDFNMEYLRKVEAYILSAARKANTPVIINRDIASSILIAALVLYWKLLKI